MLRRRYGNENQKQSDGEKTVSLGRHESSGKTGRHRSMKSRKRSKRLQKKRNGAAKNYS
jgi:hypothetical protein